MTLIGLKFLKIIVDTIAAITIIDNYTLNI